MTSHKNNRDQGTKRIRRIARIWSAPLILYALIMFIGYGWNWVTTGVADPYVVEGTSFVEALPPILMFVSVLGLGIAWRWDGIGGAITLVFQVATILLLLFQGPSTDEFTRSAIPYLMSLVITIPGILFLVDWWRSKAMNGS